MLSSPTSSTKMLSSSSPSPASPASLSSSSTTTLSSPTPVLTTTTMISSSSVGEQVRTLIPVTTANGSKVFVSGPCILLKAGVTPTVAQQMQALRPLLKAENKNNGVNNNNSNNNKAVSQTANKNNNKSTISSGGSDENEPEALRCKRRIDFSSLGLPRPQPAAMTRRNERERNRVKQVNMGFETLRQHVPTGRKNKKLSKVDTLKEAVIYIKYLQQLLQEADSRADGDLSSVISDTINIVSRATATTTVTSPTPDSILDVSSPLSSMPSPLSPVSTAASSLEEMTAAVAEAEADFSASDLLQLSAVAMDVDSTVVMETTSQLSLDSQPQLSIVDNQPQLSMVDNQPQLDSQLPLLDNASHLTLADPHSQLSLLDHSTRFPMQPSPDMPLPPSATPVLTPASTTSSSSQTSFYFSTASSPECSPVSLQNMELHYTAGSDRCQRWSEAPCSKRSDGGWNEASCSERSDGASCPVSPSDSSEASDASYEDMKDVGCETWQDLSADIKDWLCSKIDIDDPEVFTCPAGLS